MDDNLAVCGTVEIESSDVYHANTAEDVITAQLTAAANAAESASNDRDVERSRRSKSARSKLFLFKEETPTTSNEHNNFDKNAAHAVANTAQNYLAEVLQRKNRRFGPCARQMKREKEQVVVKETFPYVRERVYTRESTRARICLYADLHNF